MNIRFLALLSLVGLVSVGCGGAGAPDERFQLSTTAEVAHAQSMRGIISSLEKQLKSEGINGLKTELSYVEESFEEFRGDDVGASHKETYTKLMDQIKALKADVESGKAKGPQAAEAIQAMLDLAGSLPQGEAAPAAAN